MRQQNFIKQHFVRSRQFATLQAQVRGAARRVSSAAMSATAEVSAHSAKTDIGDGWYSPFLEANYAQEMLLTTRHETTRQPAVWDKRHTCLRVTDEDVGIYMVVGFYASPYKTSVQVTAIGMGIYGCRPIRLGLYINAGDDWWRGVQSFG